MAPPPDFSDNARGLSFRQAVPKNDAPFHCSVIEVDEEYA